MDTRSRILVVEDIDDMRETWLAVFERENYRADGAENAATAFAAIDKCSYHVALVDIMLAGKEDASNRDGVEVLKRLQNLGEGTRALVLSAQKSDIALVRDLLREYDAVDYVPKWDIQEKGNDFLLKQVAAAVTTSELGKPLTWGKIVPTLSKDMSEGTFVSNCLHNLEFSGGFENLSRSLLAVCQHLVPLFLQAEGTSGIRLGQVPGVFSGTYWSKGQGVAIELLLYGKNASKQAVEDMWHLADQTLIYDRERGNLTIKVFSRPDLVRAEFVGSVP